MNLGEQIKEKRQEANLTQQELADKMHVSRQTISHWEVSRSYPDIESLIRLSDLFSISLDKLLKGDKKMISSLKKKSIIEIFYKILVGMLMVSSLICIVIDLILNMGLSWSLIVTGGCIYVGIFLTVIMKSKRERLLKSYLSLSILLFPLLATIQYSMPEIQWFWTTGWQVAFIWLTLSWLPIFLWRFTKMTIWWLLVVIELAASLGNILTFLLINPGTTISEYLANFVSLGLANMVLLIVFIGCAITNIDNGKIDRWFLEHIRIFTPKNN